MQEVEQYQNPAETFKRDPYSYAQEGKYNGYNPLFAGNQQAPGKGADWNWLSVYFSSLQSSLQNGSAASGSRFTSATIFNLYLPNMIQGSVLFAGSGGLVTQDNTNFYWDDTTNQFETGDGTKALPPIASRTNPTTGLFWGNTGRIGVSILGNFISLWRSTGMVLGSGDFLGWMSGADITGTEDLTLFRDAANSLGQRNGTAAQTFSIYNTFTSGTPDYERWNVVWSANVCKMFLGTSGTGTTRNMDLCVGGSSAGPIEIRIGTSANGGLILGCQTSSATPFTSGMVVVGNAVSHSATSSTTIGTIFNTGFTDGGTNSTTVAYLTQLSPTINYTGAARTGKVYLQYLNPTLTSLPTGNNAGIAFSSAFTSSTFPAMRFWNTADEVTDTEFFEQGWHIAANVYGIRTNKTGTGTARQLTLYYSNTTTRALTVSTNVNGGCFVGGTSFASTFALGLFAVGAATYSALSGTLNLQVNSATFQDGGSTSTTVVSALQLSPTINYTAASKTGKVNLLYLAPTLTAQPTGNNGGLVFSSAFTSSTFPAILAYNTADEDTNWERFEAGWHVAANKYAIRTGIGGTGTTRDLEFYVCNTTSLALRIPQTVGSSLFMSAFTISSATRRVVVSNTNTQTATSGTASGLTVNDSYSPTSTSTMVAYGVEVAPVINYSAGTPGSGSVYAVYIKPTNTALPTGISAAIALASTASGINGIVWNNQTDEQTNYENVKAYYTGNIWTLISSASGTGTVRDMKFDPGTGDIIWGKALVALGAGAAATLGTIGGTGPATAAQNTWMRIKDSAGNAAWIPVWK